METATRQRLRGPVEALFLALITVWFLAFTWQGLLVYFHADDMMNLYGAWTADPVRLAIGAALPFTTEYRPLAGALYRLTFDAAGFAPLPFRITAYALLLLNIWMVYRLALRLTASREAGLLAALLFSYHAALIDIYANHGTIYDILCVTFFLAATLYYLGIREKGTAGIRATALFLALYFAALNSKEMAVTLPALILLYEAIYHPPSRWRLGEVWRWMRANAAPGLLGLAAGAVATWRKTAEGSPFYRNEGYAAEPTLTRVLENLRHLHQDMLYIEDPGLGLLPVLLLLGVVVAIPVLLRRRDLLWLAAFVLITPLPIVAIPYRGPFVMYLPYVGWAIYCAAILQLLVNRLLRATMRALYAPVRTMLLLAAMAALLFPLHLRGQRLTLSIPERCPSQPRIHHFRDQLASLPRPKAGTPRMLLLNSEFDPGEWTPLFVARLLFRDRNLVLDISGLTHPEIIRTSRYDVVLDFEHRRYVQRVSAPPRHDTRN